MSWPDASHSGLLTGGGGLPLPPLRGALKGTGDEEALRKQQCSSSSLQAEQQWPGGNDLLILGSLLVHRPSPCVLLASSDMLQTRQREIWGSYFSP